MRLLHVALIAVNAASLPLEAYARTPFVTIVRSLDSMTNATARLGLEVLGARGFPDVYASVWHHMAWISRKLTTDAAEISTSTNPGALLEDSETSVIYSALLDYGKTTQEMVSSLAAQADTVPKNVLEELTMLHPAVDDYEDVIIANIPAWKDEALVEKELLDETFVTVMKIHESLYNK